MVKCILFVKFILIIGLCCVINIPENVKADDNSVIIELTDEDRIALTIQALSDAIDNPNWLNLEILSVAIPPDKFTKVSEKIKNLYDRESFKNLSTSDNKKSFSISQFTKGKDKDSYIVNCKLQFNPGELQFEDVVNITLSRGELAFQIENIDDIISQTQNFTNAVLPMINTKMNSSVRKDPILSASTQYYQSNNMLKPHVFYNNHTRVNQNFCNSENNGKRLFSKPTGIMPFFYRYEGKNDFNRDFLIASDQHWNRLVASELNLWATAIGEYGDDTLEFNNPMGLAVYSGRYWILADGYNNRGIVYSLDWYNGDLEFQFYLEHNFDYVPDVAAASIPSIYGYQYDSTQIYVVDRGNGKIALFNLNGNHVMDYPIPGNGIFLKRPTSVCIGRNYLTNYYANWIYVVDDETNIVYCMGTTGARSVSYTPLGTFPSDARLVSVDVDNFGNVYVVDNYNSQIYLLGRGLQEVIAVFGSQGEADNQLNWPNSFHVAEGWRDLGSGTRLEPIITGNAFATEFFSTNTGIRSYILHGDLLEYELSYIPMITEGSNDYFRCDWKTSGTNWCEIKVYDQFDQLKDEYTEDLNLPGNNHYEYLLALDDYNNMYYRYEIDIYSKYTNDLIGSINDSILINRYVDSSYHDSIYHAIIIEDFGVDDVIEYNGMLFGVQDGLGLYTDECLFIDTNKIWYFWVKAQDLEEVLRPLYYRFAGYENAVKFTSDNLIGEITWHDTLVTSSPRAFCKIIGPGCVYSDGLSKLMSVRIQDINGLPYDDCLMPCYPYADYYNYIYDDLELTPCATCCSQRGNVKGEIGEIADVSDIMVDDMVYLINYLFRGGPPPPCVEQGNVNGLGPPTSPIDVADATYLVNFVFKGGPEPPPCELTKYSIPKQEKPDLEIEQNINLLLEGGK